MFSVTLHIFDRSFKHDVLSLESLMNSLAVTRKLWRVVNYFGTYKNQEIKNAVKKKLSTDFDTSSYLDKLYEPRAL